MSSGTVTLYIAASVDGYIATEDGGVSWLDAFHEETEDDAGDFEAFFASIDCLLMGSKTYEQVMGFGEWPYGQKPTYVVTRRELPRANEAIELFDGPVDGLVERLKGEYDHVWLVGGAQLAQTVLRSDQIDRLHLSRAPILLGGGIPLFDDAGETRDLTLLNTVARDSGIVELRYGVDRT
ncbi:dihydrofolate reductase family protein [Halocatena pleomorpha]|uniref:Dihydrofolate reductase n=1 Tax=Halocatena pleomorpha TaxID=1785090 RepID=A0A3P3R857_9EURY|nr:dihydrofolate reductase family protein [Halocatena pleomorpha]RRJ29109.1 dihydrofolate reductase [Halocatena pleomorpha]